jgi:hypothetical protein
MTNHPTTPHHSLVMGCCFCGILVRPYLVPSLSRYALTELLETERDYVKELKHAIDQFDSLFKEDLPEELLEKREVLLANLNDIYNFHNE